MQTTPPLILTYSIACLYVLSGVTQPLLMTVVKNAGLADPMCQLYMLFYYLGPALVAFTLCDRKEGFIFPDSETLIRTSAIAIFDIFGQTLNYTGAAYAGPTIFAIVYSSVTVWTAVFSRILISRYMNLLQWISVFVVFSGLAITAFSSVALGPQVFKGSCFVLVGSSIHALTYVFNEVLMTRGLQKVPIRLNCSLQGIVAFLAYLIWQILYTRQHFTELIVEPMQHAHTTTAAALLILLSLSCSNLIHSLSYFHTIKYFPVGAVSAGVMKGLQAVLVFVFTSLVFCGKTGGEEMCFNHSKFVSIIIVVSGVLLYAKATVNGTETESTAINRSGYRSIAENANLDRFHNSESSSETQLSV